MISPATVQQAVTTAAAASSLICCRSELAGAPVADATEAADARKARTKRTGPETGAPRRGVVDADRVVTRVVAERAGLAGDADREDGDREPRRASDERASGATGAGRPGRAAARRRPRRGAATHAQLPTRRPTDAAPRVPVLGRERRSRRRAETPSAGDEAAEDPADRVRRPPRGDDQRRPTIAQAMTSASTVDEHEVARARSSTGQRRQREPRTHEDSAAATERPADDAAGDGSLRRAPQPERHVRRLHRLADDAARDRPRSSSSSTSWRSRAPNASSVAGRRSGAGRSGGRRSAARASAAAGTAPRRRASRRRSPGSSRRRTTRTPPAPPARGPAYASAEQHRQHAVDERARDQQVDVESR